ncbi:MAG: uroporphyrinogen decarboxylase family protein [Anaerolineaceae bacterium]|nr:uroporphyrinogen decarboxylase family protein [Anaerolineaceae bacterium]
MNSRQRVIQAINHKEPDRVPLDLGGGPTSGMHVSSVYLIRQALHLDPPGTPVKVVEPYQMLGEIKLDMIERLGVDVIPLGGRKNMFGFENKNWKPWTFFDGTPVLVPESFNTTPEDNGDILMYPEGDHSAPASGRLPAGGYYFDGIVRQPPIDDDKLDPRLNLEEFTVLAKQDLDYLHDESVRLDEQTDLAILGNFGGMAFGDIALVPAPNLKYPKGVRDVAEWYMSTVTRRDYVYKVFEGQCAVALKNLQLVHEAVGERITAIFMSGTDFGMQTRPLISPKAYRSLYMPFQKELNDWVHKNTTWKVFIHCCGSIMPLIPDMIEAGFDLFNPVQTSAANMDPQELKNRFGSQITFWGGGVDTQKTLPFGKPEEIRKQVQERLQIFGKGGGFVFNSIHNVQAGIPIENLLALYQAVQEFRSYPV